MQNYIVFITTLAMAMPRFIVLIAICPLFALLKIPKTIIGVVSFSLVLPVAASNMHYIDSVEMHLYPFIFIKEVYIGLFIAILFSIPFWVFKSTGAYIDNQRGALSSGYMNPAAGPDASMVGELMLKSLIVIFMESGMYVVAIAFVYESYLITPFTEYSITISKVHSTTIIDAFNDMAIKYTLYSGPIILVLLLVEAAFAILGAYSPQIQVYFAAMPAKCLMALIVLLLLLTYVDYILVDEYNYFMSAGNLIRNIFSQ